MSTCFRGIIPYDHTYFCPRKYILSIVVNFEVLIGAMEYIVFKKRGSVQPGCILGGLRFRSTTLRSLKFVCCFQQQVFREKRLRNGST
jgi:hypothetical protein